VLTYLQTFDWGQTPLGPKKAWSPVLRTIYELMMHSGFGMCAAWGPERIFLYNQAYAPFLGARHPAALGQKMDDVWHEIWPHIAPLVARATAGETVIEENMHLVMTRNGYAEDTYWTFSYSPIRDGDVIVGMFDVAYETTSLIEAQRREQVSAERVRLALNAGAIMGTWFWDIPSDSFSVDPAFAHSFGLDPNLGATHIPLARIIDTVHPDDKEALLAAINCAIARGGAYAHQYRVRRSDGKYYWIEANGRVDLAADGTAQSFPGVLIDVEERRAVEAERDRAIAMLRQLNDQLEQRVLDRTSELLKTEEALRQSQKMEAVGQLTGGLAHDFNNLLTGISGSLELIGVRLSQGRTGDVVRYLDVAHGAARRAAALTHRLLAFSRRQTLDPKPTNVNRLVAGLEELIRRTVGPSVDLEVHAGADLWPALVDPSQLENALPNLCINARDAMPDGGRITIQTANIMLEPPAAGALALPQGDYLLLRVADTGVGMPPDITQKVFEPFFTTKPIGEGTGLGLSMVYGFAQQSGGQVEVQSELGRGTELRIYLPRHAMIGVIEDLPALPEAAPPSQHSETILVIDDEPTVRMLVTELLQDFGYTTIEAVDGKGGLQIIQSPVPIDLLITDVGLPGGMNGRQIADAARKMRPDLKVLFITGYAETATVRDGHLEPGMGVMAKPFAIDALAARVREMMDHG
jgi:signal transduction histidine kinase/CheY-like chemotaxis protein